MPFTLSKLTSLLFSLLLFTAAAGQNKCLLHSHSHNDYKQDRPLADALSSNFSSVEADVFLVNGELLVSHLRPLFKKRTLEDLYLKPLLELSEKQNGMIYADAPLILLVDIKSDARKTYKALQPLLLKYSKLLTRFENGKVIQGAVTVILSGNKPHEEMISDATRYAFIDKRLLSDSNLSENIYLMASAKYSSIISWKGSGVFPPKEKALLLSLVDSAHRNGKTVRLWDSPENQVIWKELLACGVDLINTDKLKMLHDFLLANPEP